MKRLAILPIVAAMLMVTAPAALARAHPYYTVRCSDGNSYESVDAHAVEQGQKGDAVENFSENTPSGLDCELRGPFNP